MALHQKNRSREMKYHPFSGDIGKKHGGIALLCGKIAGLRV
jgi:hypothetical protein